MAMVSEIFLPLSGNLQMNFSLRKSLSWRLNLSRSSAELRCPKSSGAGGSKPRGSENIVHGLRLARRAGFRGGAHSGRRLRGRRRLWCGSGSRHFPGRAIAKLKAAIAEHEEVRARSELFHPVSVDCKLRQKAATRVDTDVDKAQNSDLMLDTSSLVPDCSSVDKSFRTTSETQGPAHLTPRGNEETLEAGCAVNPGAAPGSKARAPSSEVNEHLPQCPVSSQAEDISSGIDSLFLTKLQKMTFADQSEPSEENISTENVPGLQSETPKRPHYMEVLEMRAKHPMPPPHKFKTNVLPTQQSDSPSHCQRGESPASSEEQRRRARQHLDDITAARLLPLHHLPAQLLTIEESLALQKEQKQNYEEMQAKLAAQKLAERLNIKMQSYNPEGESSGRYREVRDEDDAQSSDEF